MIVTKDLMPKFIVKDNDFILTLYNLNYLERHLNSQNVAQENGVRMRVNDRLGTVLNQTSAQNVVQAELKNVAQGDGLNNKGSKYEEIILMLVKTNNKITREQMAQALGVSTKTVEREISKISKLSFAGSGYSGHWEIKE